MVLRYTSLLASKFTEQKLSMGRESDHMITLSMKNHDTIATNLVAQLLHILSTFVMEASSHELAQEACSCELSDGHSLAEFSGSKTIAVGREWLYRVLCLIRQSQPLWAVAICLDLGKLFVHGLGYHKVDTVADVLQKWQSPYYSWRG